MSHGVDHAARCPACGSPLDPDALRCPCEVLRHDEVRQLSARDAESLVAVKRGRDVLIISSMLVAAAAGGAVLVNYLAPWIYVLPILLPFVIGTRRVLAERAARRAEAASQIQLPEARVLLPIEK